MTQLLATSTDPDLPAPLTRVQAVRSAFWAAFGALGRYLLAGITTLILTRLLAPADFGLIALTAVVQALITLIIPGGFHDALIQRPRLNDADLNGAFWSVAILSGGCVLLVVVLAPMVAAAFNEPALALLLPVVALVSTLHALDTIPRALLNRNLDFRRLAIARLAGMVLSGAAAILVAALGGGVWSLVAQTAILNLTTLIMLWRAVGWIPARPRRLTRSSLVALWPFAASISTSAVIGYIILNADDQLIGYHLGSRPLGFYAMAYSLIAWPSRDVLGSVAAVLYPISTRVQHDLPRLHTVYLESVQLTTAFAFPVLAWITITAPVFFPWLLGPRWAPAVLTAQILALGGLRASAMVVNGLIYRARAKPHLQSLFQLCSIGPYLVAIVIGLDWGIEGVAFFYILVGAVLHPVSLWMVLSTAQLRLSRWISALLPITTATALMSIAAALTLHLTRSNANFAPFPALVASGGVSVLVYSAVLYVWQPAGLARNLRAAWEVVRSLTTLTIRRFIRETP